MAAVVRPLMPEHIRIALERARANPMPPGPERDKLLADADAVKIDPSTCRTHDEVMADLQARQPRAAE
jgi:hypothetical protein